MYSGVITYTNSRANIQVYTTSGILCVFALSTLLLGPYRNEASNLTEGCLTLLASATILGSWLYETDQITQSWIVCSVV